MSTDFWTFFFLCLTAFLAGGAELHRRRRYAVDLPFAHDGPWSGAGAMANGTSTVALLPGSFAGALGYRPELWECRRFVFRMIVPSFIGGYIGAWLVGKYPDTFNELVPWLILTSALLFVIQAPISRWVKKRALAEAAELEHREAALAGATVDNRVSLSRRALRRLLRRGIGILMLSALGFMGVGDIHRMNAVKTFLAATINTASAIRFIPDNLVNWRYALPMMATAILGGYVGACARACPRATSATR